MIEHSTAILTPEHQIDLVQSVTNLNQYLEFYDKHFPLNGGGWQNKLQERITAGDLVNPTTEFWRFEAYIALLFAQNDFESMLGQMGKTLPTATHPQIGRRKQLALACYGGKINNQTLSYRQDWIEQLEEYFPEAALGVWGLRFHVSNGIASPMATNILEVKQLAQQRYNFNRPIYLPDQTRNRQLSELRFSHSDAERMSTAQIDQLILPQAQTIFNGVLDLDAVFRPGTY